MLAPFQIQGPSILIAATTAAASAQQVSTGSQQGALVTVQGSTQHAFVAFSNSSSVQAAVPTTSTPGIGAPVQPGSAQPFTIPPNAWASAITSSGTVNVFITPGFGT